MTWTIPPVSEPDCLRAPDGTAYDVSGPPDAPCVVLIHGLGLARGLWDPVLPDLQAYRVVRYDLCGHGQSRPAPDRATLALYARQIAQLLDHLGQSSAHIVGFSIGGMINRRFAMDYPARTRSLVILNAPHDRGPQMQIAVEERAKAVREQGAFATFDAALKRWFTPAYLQGGAGPDIVRAWRGAVDAESYAQTAWVLAHGVRELIAPDPPLRVPALVMTCAHDSGSTPDMSRAIAAEIDGAHLRIVPHLQHLGLMEAPELFAQAIAAFLDQTAP